MPKFQSTPPRGGATCCCPLSASLPWNFNPRPREGGRQGRGGAGTMRERFQSTPPRGGATAAGDRTGHGVSISIHAPARGGDTSCTYSPAGRANFNPRPREGGRRWLYPNGGRMGGISIHAPARGGDSKDAQFYLRIFDKQVELLRFLGKMRGGCLRNPEKDRRFLGKSLANLPEISGHLDFAGA